MLEVFRSFKVVETGRIVRLILDEFPKRDAAVALLLRTGEVVLNRLASSLAGLAIILCL